MTRPISPPSICAVFTATADLLKANVEYVKKAVLEADQEAEQKAERRRAKRVDDDRQAMDKHLKAKQERQDRRKEAVAR